MDDLLDLRTANETSICDTNYGLCLKCYNSDDPNCMPTDQCNASCGGEMKTKCSPETQKCVPCDPEKELDCKSSCEDKECADSFSKCNIISGKCE